MFTSVSSGCCICLQWFSNVFQTFSQVFHTLVLKCFICLLLYVATVASGCFKSRTCVTHGMHVGSSERRRRYPGRRGTIASALPREPDALGTRSLLVRATSKSVSYTLIGHHGHNFFWINHLLISSNLHR
jgi:hypothetical protein